MELAGRPMLAWVVEAFARADGIDAIVVAGPPGQEDRVERLVREAAEVGRLDEPRVVAGGDSRSRSVARALEAVVGAGVVAVHDAARPLVTPDLIDALLMRLAKRPEAAGVIAGSRLTDTVKRAGESRPTDRDPAGDELSVTGTVSREHLWLAQTPQVFRTAALRQALAVAGGHLGAATDDAMLVEAAGGEVLIHAASPENLKVTTSFDLAVAEMLLAERGAQRRSST